MKETDGPFIVGWAPELLFGILGFTDARDLPAAARVCRAWYPCAAEYIWRDSSLFNLLQIFCPMVQDPYTKLWVRVDRYHF